MSEKRVEQWWLVLRPVISKWWETRDHYDHEYNLLIIEERLIEAIQWATKESGR